MLQPHDMLWSSLSLQYAGHNVVLSGLYAKPGTSYWHVPVAIICLGRFLVFALDVVDLIDDQLFEAARGALESVDSVGDFCLDIVAFGHGRVLDLQQLVFGLINNLQGTGQTA